MGNKNCNFCSIIEKRENLIYEDEYFVMFKDIHPDAEVHIQAVPRQHIKNINYLSKNDLELINHMKLKAKEFIISNL